MSYTDCGTERGYGHHKARNEPACEYCKSWKRKHDAGLVVVAPVRSRAQVAQCGTPSGAAKHRRNGEAACKACRESVNENARKRRKEARDPDTKTISVIAACGTVSGYARHVRFKETVCDPCRTAKREYSRERKRIARAQDPPRVLQPCGTSAAAARHRKKK